MDEAGLSVYIYFIKLVIYFYFFLSSGLHAQCRFELKTLRLSHVCYN